MPRSARHGFTLVELVMVLGILIIISSIGVVAFANVGKVNRLTGTEQMVAALFRQARYTARATGQAVLVYLDKQEGTISGISRLPIWQSLCESGLPPFASGQLATTDYLAPAGRSGSGLTYATSAPPAQAAAIPLFDPASTDPDLRSRARQLTRSFSGPTEGFQLGCAVFTPSLAPSSSSTTPVWLPLVLIDGGSGTAIPGSDDAFAGLALVRREMPMFALNAAPTGLTANPAPALTRPVYDLVGWVRVGNAVVAVSQLHDAVEAGQTTAMNDSDRAARSLADDGGTWQEVSLIFTGPTLELYRQGVLVARTTGTVPLRIDGYGSAHRLVFGAGTLGTGLSATMALPPTSAPATCSAVLGPASSEQQLPFTAVLDDIQLVRLGADQPQHLPSGVVADDTYRTLVRPDGRIQDFTSAGAGAGATWSFSGVFAEADDKAIIQINASGAVSSSKLKLSRSAP